MGGGAVGLVGCGLLGSAIAERLVGAGLCVAAYDVNDERARHVQSFGAERCSRVELIGERSRRIVLCLPDSTIVREVLRELVSSLRPETLIVDTTTGDAGTQRRERSGGAICA